MCMDEGEIIFLKTERMIKAESRARRRRNIFLPGEG